MTDERLKPCPFCGSESKIMEMDLSGVVDGWKLYGVACVDDVEAEYAHAHYIDNYRTKEEAIEAWNRRVVKLGGDA